MLNVIERKREIQRLRSEIKVSGAGQICGRRENWLFEPEPPVSAFDGIGPLVVIAYRPSTSSDPCRPRLNGPITAQQVGFDCHLTDCIKTPSQVKYDQNT